MPDLPPGQLVWLGIVAILAGLVRGFSGFGTALIYVPLAGIVLPPIWVLVTLTIMDMVGPLPNVPRAWRDGRPREVAVIGLAALTAMIPSLWLLTRLDGDAFRWLVAAICLTTVALMATGWRWRGRRGRGLLLGSGAVSGLLGGVSGLAGPPVILTYMTAPLPVAAIRGSILLYLVLWDVMFGAVLLLRGLLDMEALVLGLALIVPYLAANILGARLFHPDRERLYRQIAYAIITAAALVALPIFTSH
ncbi:MAG: sulfite exporter TauE/SafE family protein [Pseudomonadota bacterium]